MHLAMKLKKMFQCEAAAALAIALMIGAQAARGAVPHLTTQQIWPAVTGQPYTGYITAFHSPALPISTMVVTDVPNGLAAWTPTVAPTL